MRNNHDGERYSIGHLLDTHADIDALIIDGGLTHGVGLRIQCHDEWQTFTFRLSRENGQRTQWEKLVAAVDRGGMYPTRTVHAYIRSGGKIVFAIARTRELVQWVQAHRH